MSLGPFLAVDSSLKYKGNKLFSQFDEVRNKLAPNMSSRHLDLVKDSTRWKNLITLYDNVINATIDFMRNDGAIFFDIPITTRMISSPGALNGRIPSDVHPFKINMFENETFLTQSSQLYLEFAITTPGIDKAYCIDKSFRMERANFRHLPEFTHIEYEANINFEQNLRLQEMYLKFLIRHLLEKSSDALGFFLHADDIEELANLSNNSRFEIISFLNAFKLLKKATGNARYDNATIGNFEAYDEVLLTQILGNKPVFVTHFIADEVAFYHALDDKDKKLAVNADLFFPGYGEIVGGGERVHTLEDTENKAKHFELNMDDYRVYIESRGHATSRIHSGWGMGIERFLQAVLKMPFIWDVKPFPRVDNSTRP